MSYFFPKLLFPHFSSSTSYVFYCAFCFVLSFVTKQLVARGVKVAVGAVGGAPPPAAPATQPSDSTPQEDASKATPSSRPTTPAISMTAALKDVGAVSHPSH